MRLGRLVGVVIAGTLACAVALLLAALLGPHTLDLGRALGAPRSPDAQLLWSVRLPRAVLGLLAGAALGAVGASLQALTRNPLAEPYVLGTSGGAALGGAVAVALGASMDVGLPLASFGGALGATLLVAWIASRSREGGALSMLLAGVIVNAFAGAGITLVRVLVDWGESQRVFLWLVGGIGYERWPTLGAASLYVGAGIAVLVASSGGLRLLALGDEAAEELGVRVARLRAVVFVASAVVVGGVVALCGPIGFVGLVVPHAARLVLGPDPRLLIPASALFGACFLVLADLLARVAFGALGTEPPVGAVTAAIGCPVFLTLLVRRRD